MRGWTHGTIGNEAKARGRAPGRLALGLGLVGIALGGACGDDASPLPDASPILDGRADEYQPQAIGLINLIGGAGGEVLARLRDRPDPLAPEVRGRHGECALYVRPTPAACTPRCGEDSVCIGPDECAPLDRQVSAGVITVSGLRQRLVFRPMPDGYRPESLPPDELFDAGARIRVSAPGAEVPGFSAELDGVPRLVVGFSRIELSPDRDTRLVWTAAGVGRVAAVLAVGRPAAPFSSMLLCESDDYGALTIPAQLARSLPRPGPDEEERATMIRLQRTVLAAAAGPIEILAGKKVTVELVRQ
jgi:hypothetical protein